MTYKNIYTNDGVTQGVGRLVRKLIMMWDHMHWGVGSGTSLSAGRVLGTFQMAQEFTTQWMSENILGY